jgi:hypothetical protein
MSFVPDGVRSTRRKKIGDNLLALAKDMKQMCLTKVANGFRYRVLDLGGVDKVYIKAPMGCAIMCASKSDVFVCSSEYWLDVISKRKTLSVAVPRLQRTTAVYPAYNRFYEIEVLPGGTPVQSEPLALGQDAARGIIQPVSVPLSMSELVIRSLSFSRNLTATPYNVGSPDNWADYFWNPERLEISTDLFLGSGAGENRYGVIRGVDYQYHSSSWTVQPITGGKFVFYYGSNAPWFSDALSMVTTPAWVVDMSDPANTSFQALSANDLWADLPFTLLLGIYTLPSLSASNILLHPIGCYAHGNTILNVIFNRPVSGSYFYGEAEANRKWHIFYTLKVGDVVHTVNGDNIYAVLCQIHGVPPIPYSAVWSSNLTALQEMAQQLLPYPNISHYWRHPHDSAMFHGPGGIYTWTRGDGAVRWGETGLEIVTINVPAAVSSEAGVRPEITYGDDTFLCVCNRIGDKIVGIYTGSPFEGSWATVALPVSGDLVYVRPIKVSVASLKLSGVVRTVVDGKYKFNLTVLTGGVWKLLAAIDAPDTEAHYKWDVCFYGEGDFTADMLKFQAPPAATQQPWHLPYAEYPAVSLPGGY